ncbi:MAG: aminodeoxychorismate synthase component I [Caldimicrobium sp.]|nr:aminodeoxychorismate synthase component I [Caldimicrobium sp.]MCX7873180.1 aminodeoxychorismate synthase component I [Caldimicrobium sp.]MDW8094241.1 aminodeoxychorismate synthase component I [Caldimicrobium sp.]
MRPQFLFLNAKNIPFRGYLFQDLKEEIFLTPENVIPEVVEEFFKRLEGAIRKGYYALGFLTYELGYLLEPRLNKLLPAPCFPLAYFALFRKVKPLYLYPLEKEEGFEIYLKGLNYSPEEYRLALSKIKNYIAKGDTYQVNFTVKLKYEFKGEPFKLFLSLLFSQRCEYAFYIEKPQFIILSLSPELFLKKRRTLLLSSPMKGTLSRAPLEDRDRIQKRLLKKSPKVKAENLMIVDLIRNDLGKISTPGSVWVKKFLQIKTYPTLHQMISTVQGNLKEFSFYKIFQALFPCGSVTGAPKIRTMEIIRELEKEPRGVYTGAIGYLTPEGDFLFNVAIRTLVLEPLSQEHYRGELGIGAGILWDSIEQEEYDETLLKANFLLKRLPFFKIFETFWWSKDRENSLLWYHYQRMLSSARYFKFVLPLALKSFQNFREYLEENLTHKTGYLLRVKVLLTPEGRIELETQEFKSLYWEKPLKVGLLQRSTPLSVFHYHKTTHREEYDRAYLKAKELGLGEILFYNERGELLEGSISNIFLERGGHLYTPPLDLGILPGILRKKLISEGKVKEAFLTLEDLKNCSNLWIGNSLRGLGKVEDWIIL